MQFYSYLRVSTTKQGFDGLGVESQREAVRRYCDQVQGELLGEFVEVESGKRNNRPVLAEALAACRTKRATLVIAKLDRLGRSVSFIAGLMDTKVPFVAVDMPFATPLLLHVMSAFAQHEREMISARTRGALAAAKARGAVLGANGKVLAAKNRADAMAHAETVRQAIVHAREAGCVSLPQIAAFLTKHGHKTAAGGRWYPTTVRRVLARMQAPDA
ncbi:MAG: recombinase family protein [Novosphingobium sp.]|uniref:recombinase family protein n=1 Tax=Novosphingobium sp. TaxID=1874826 RepID=UPI0030188828